MTATVERPDAPLATGGDSPDDPGGPPPLARPPRQWANKLGGFALWAWAIAGLLFILAPIIVTILFSFNNPEGRYNYTWNEFSLDAWTDPFRYPDLAEALGLSLRVAAVVTLISTALGTLMGLAMVKYRFRAKGIVGGILILPLTMPEVVLGFSLLTLFVTVNWTRGFVTIVIAQVMFSISYVAVTVRARIRGFDWRLEEAAADLGAGPWRTFVRITLPIIAPGVVAAALLTFALSLDDFIITYLNSGLSETFPINVWITKRSRIPPQINVFTTTLLLVSILIAAATLYWSYRQGKKMAAPGASDED
jgi:spermidine/putrescine transport system permease protein